MDNLLQLQTIRAEPRAPEGKPQQNAILVQIYPTGAEIGTRYTVGVVPLIVGRGETSDIRINDGSVSRRHAVVQADEGGWTITDLGSTNGIYLNDVAVNTAQLQDGDY